MRQAEKKYRQIIKETPQSLEPIRGRGASWSPANRFEKLHVDVEDGTGIAPLETASARDERCDRSVSTGREKVADYARLSRSVGKISQSGCDHHEEPSRDARYRFFARARDM